MFSQLFRVGLGAIALVSCQGHKQDSHSEAQSTVQSSSDNRGFRCLADSGRPFNVLADPPQYEFQIPVEFSSISFGDGRSLRDLLEVDFDPKIVEIEIDDVGDGCRRQSRLFNVVCELGFQDTIRQKATWRGENAGEVAESFFQSVFIQTGRLMHNMVRGTGSILGRLEGRREEVHVGANVNLSDDNCVKIEP